MRRIMIAALAVLAISVTACAQPLSEGSSVSPSPSSPSTPTASPTKKAETKKPETSSPSMTPRIQAAMTDAGARAGVPAAEVTVVEERKVQWSDGSLGCPEPGKMYTQALVPGSLLVLKAKDKTMEYHAGEDAEYAFCANPSAPASSSIDR